MRGSPALEACARVGLGWGCRGRQVTEPRGLLAALYLFRTNHPLPVLLLLAPPCSYYAFYWYGQLAGTTRLEVASADPALGVWAGRAGRTLTLVLWNRSMQPRSAALSLPAVPGWWPCLLHRVDDLSFTVQAPGLEAIIAGPTSRLPPVEAGVTTVAQALAYFAANPLRPEASAALTIWMSSNVEGLQLE